MEKEKKREKVIVVGAGPVGSLAALYAANRGNDVEVYELRGGKLRNNRQSFVAFSIIPDDTRIFGLFFPLCEQAPSVLLIVAVLASVFHLPNWS
jgi:alanine dehydrogenase